MRSAALSFRAMAMISALISTTCMQAVDASVSSSPVASVSPNIIAPGTALQELPPSPSTASGVRQWTPPLFSHWPAIAYADESRHIAFSLPVQKPGLPARIGWLNEPAASVTLPEGTDVASGLLLLPTALGNHPAQVRIAEESWILDVRVVDVRKPWPIVGMVHGFPVDEHQLPVVLQDRRRHAQDERRFRLLEQGLPRPTGKAYCVGDAMEALGKRAWDTLDAEQRPVSDERYPQHAALVALASMPSGADAPRTILWCPGNQVLYGGAWAEEEERLMGAVVSRCEFQRIAPLCVLALPPMPVDAALQDIAHQRRTLLTRCATQYGWIVIDLAAAAGPATEANRSAENVYTRYPQGAAQERMRDMLAMILKR